MNKYAFRLESDNGSGDPLTVSVEIISGYSHVDLSAAELMLAKEIIDCNLNDAIRVVEKNSPIPRPLEPRDLPDLQFC